MSATFIILAAITIASAVAAMSLRNLIHCALALAVTFAGLAALYLRLDAQFVGLAQILVYVGAVAILIVFAILLTRGRELSGQSLFSSSWRAGVGVAVLVFGVLAGLVLSSRSIAPAAPPAPSASVHQLGYELMTKWVLPLEVIGLLLTVALIGAVIIAMHEK